MSRAIRIGVVGLLFNGKKILLGQRKKELGKGQWELPGGHLEFGESLEECLRREFAEETGIEISVKKLVSVAPNKIYGNHYIIFAFLVSAKSKPRAKQKEPKIHLAWKWFDLNKLPPNLFVAAENAIRDFKAGKIYCGER